MLPRQIRNLRIEVYVCMYPYFTPCTPKYSTSMLRYLPLSVCTQKEDQELELLGAEQR